VGWQWGLAAGAGSQSLGFSSMWPVQMARLSFSWHGRLGEDSWTPFIKASLLQRAKIDKVEEERAGPRRGLLRQW